MIKKSTGAIFIPQTKLLRVWSEGKLQAITVTRGCKSIHLQCSLRYPFLFFPPSILQSMQTNVLNILLFTCSNQVSLFHLFFILFYFYFSLQTVLASSFFPFSKQFSIFWPLSAFRPVYYSFGPLLTSRYHFPIYFDLRRHTRRRRRRRRRKN